MITYKDREAALRNKTGDEQRADWMCHILHHDDKHVELICPTDTYSIHSVSFFPLYPLSLSIYKTGPKGIEGGWVCGICWHRLIRMREVRGGIQRVMHKEGEGPKSCGEQFKEYSTVAEAEVFHWCLERVDVLVWLWSWGACMWSHDHHATLFRNQWDLTAVRSLERRWFSFGQSFPNMLQKNKAHCLQAKCFFHIKYNTEQSLVLTVPTPFLG